MKYYFTSEQVSMGHPDKICDQISDALLDEYLTKDKNSRVAIETLIKNNTVVVAGEVTSNTYVDIENTIHSVLNDIGVDGVYNIVNLIDKQSSDIALGVDIGGAGDQGIMYGYACDETPECLPIAYVIATKALINLKNLNSPYLRPDAKSQVTVCYENGKVSIDTFLISTQHVNNIDVDFVRRIVEPIMKATALEYGMNTDFKMLVNPTGRFVIGGSFGDCGVTGRKIIADTYGGYARHGGGAFSGKDYSKVDRSAAYMARYIAKYLLKNYHLHQCEVQLSYAIGIDTPISVYVCANGFEREDLSEIICAKFDLTPRGIINFLNLKNVKYYSTAKYGHFFGNYPWENI